MASSSTQSAHALDDGPLGLAHDPATATQPGSSGRPARVLIASCEVAGPTGNGGIGTAYHSLAHVLAAAGHDVTLLYTGWLDPEQGSHEPEWRRSFAQQGIDFSLLGSPWDPPVRSPHHSVRRAYELHRWLADAHAARPFDVVHIPEYRGHGALALTAKALGLAYADVEFVVGTHSPTRWIAECNREGPEQIDALVTEHLERVSVERADVVMSPTAYLLDYMRERGWKLPERTFVQPLARPRAVRENVAAAAAHPPDELVFFGRLETRKGLEAFCDAVDLLVAGGDCPFARVTFLGRPERVMGEDATTYVERRATTWGLAWELLPDLGHAQAVAYLRGRACIAAIPSLVDNSPNTVIEVLELGVPFVASRSGGIAELIAAEDLASSTFDGWRASAVLQPPALAQHEAPFDAGALAAALRRRAAAPGRPARPSVQDTVCDRVYDEWHRAVAARPRDLPRTTPHVMPTAAVCIVADEPGDVRRVADAIATGTRAPTRVAAVCATPPSPEPPAGVHTVVAAGRAGGPAREQLLDGLDCDVVIVLRGHEDPDPELVEQVCEALAVGDSDVLALVCRDANAERSTGVPPELRRRDVAADLRAFVPAGGPALAALAYPALAVGPYAIRRAALDALGGFAPDAWGEASDRELLGRAALAGLRIDVLPNPLATTIRDDRWADLRARFWGDAPLPAPEGEELLRSLRPFAQRLPAEQTDLPALLVAALRDTGTAMRERAALVDAYERRVLELGELVAHYEQQRVHGERQHRGRWRAWLRRRP